MLSATLVSSIYNDDILGTPLSGLVRVAKSGGSIIDGGEIDAEKAAQFGFDVLKVGVMPLNLLFPKNSLQEYYLADALGFKRKEKEN